MDFILAHSRFQRRKFPQAIKICDELLQKNNKDEAAWMLKCQCLIKQNLVDELETQQQGFAQMLIKNQQKNTFAKAGTSFKSSSNHNPVMRPNQSGTGRINTGFQRANTNAGSRANTRNNTMIRTGRIMTKGGVPTTSNGRILRLSTASLQQFGQDFFDSSKIDLRKISQRKSKARIIFQYLFYVQQNIKKALQLAVFATQTNNYQDPWWKLALGKCYYKLSFYKQAEKQLHSSVRHNNNIESYLYLSKIYEKDDNVDKSINILLEAIKVHKYEPKLNIAVGRIYDQLNQIEKAHDYYKSALIMENCNIEAVANVASYFFYKQQPEISLKFYQRLIELGYQSPQIWNNMGLCCFNNNQYHLFYSCFERAILNGKDDPMIYSDVWYNIGYIYTILGEFDMALECYKTSLAYFPQNIESMNNLSVLQFQKSNVDNAINYAEKSYRECISFEACFNLSIWYYQTNQLEKAHTFNLQTLKLYPLHAESRHLKGILENKLEYL